MNTPSSPMPHPLVGRARERDLLTAAVEDARARRGSTWFLCGEPGIGKSRLAEEIARDAAARGVRTAWGRCWESGAAPGYWPWLQVLRQLLADDELRPHALGPAHRRERLAHLLPELAPERAPDRAPEQESEPAPPRDVGGSARFELLDAAASALSAISRRAPLLLVLEDLHAADASSLALLDLVAGSIQAHALLIVGTFRDAEADRSPSAAGLARLARQGRTVALARLSRADVASFVAASLAAPASEPLIDALCTTTEGHPLFLVETTRLLAAHPVDQPSGGLIAIPPTVRGAIRERLALLPARCREVLQAASVLGRDVSRNVLAAMGVDAVPNLSATLAQAADAAVLHEISPGRFRFTHILVREVLYGELEPGAREGWHRAAASTLAAAAGHDERSAQVLHHYLAAGASGRLPAVHAARSAGQRALSQLAFTEAAECLRAGLSALDQAVGEDAIGPDAALPDRADLLAELGRALLLAGDVDQGQQRCLQAARCARELRSAPLLARAALAYAATTVLATVDPTLIELLREALSAQPASELALRARLMARLASAMQPVPDGEPDEPIALAREAAAVAGKLGDPRLRLATLRAAGGAIMDVVPARERVAWNEEHVALADQLGDQDEALFGRLRLTVDRYETGEVDAAIHLVDQGIRIGEKLHHPSMRWRFVALLSMGAYREGRFADGTRLAGQARQAGADARDPNAARGLALQPLTTLYLEGKVQELVDWLPGLQPLFAADPYGQPMLRVLTGAALARVRRPCQAWLDDHAARELLRVRDQTCLEALAFLARARGDRALAEHVMMRLQPRSGGFVSGGVTGLTWDAPTDFSLALLAHARGDVAEALDRYQSAHDQALATRARPHAAWIAFEHGACLLALPDVSHWRAGRERLTCARTMAVGLGMDGLVTLIDDELTRAGTGDPTSTSPMTPPLTPPVFRLVRDGELWLVDHQQRRFHVRDAKGVRWLARLLVDPGRELHVLDLIGADGGIDGGDGGELLDATARAAYQRRVDELRDQLTEAETYADTGRAERARAELDALASELARAVGLGGRARRAGQAAERARINVQRRLRDAIERIQEQDPELGRHLSRAVRTGTFCSYDP